MSDRPDSYFNGEMKPSFDDGVDPSPASEAVELEIVSPPPRPALQSATLRQGPGLLETLGWVAGFFMAQLLLGALFFILYIVVMLVSDPDFITVLKNRALLEEHMVEAQPLMIAAVQGCLILICLTAARLRWGRHYKISVKLNSFRPIHFLAIVALILPTQVVSQAIYEQVNYVWQLLAVELPNLKLLDELNIVESAPAIIQESPVHLSFLIFVIAPAVNEELLFRGIIGNGLVHRYGVVLGILMTSVFFAIVHMHPVHVAAVFGLGAVIHWTYLTTRTIWAPMLLHFLNNGFALYSALYLGASDSEQQTSIPFWLTACSLITIGLLCLFLWKSRRQLVKPDGLEVPMDREWQVYPERITSRGFQQGMPSWGFSILTAIVSLGTLILICSDGLI